jgi:nitroimidazol reductase NimA-like FMN-containing flavoprotein (pyridoxamine 5'-phosphate oxidase superfamily)
MSDRIVLHGSPASRMLRALKEGAEAAVAVTLLDGLVLARSVFNHSMNYRSVVIVGKAAPIEDPEEAGGDAGIHPRRSFPADGRTHVPSDKEFKGTLMLGIPIQTASAKIRSGPPSDDAEDLALGVWAGVIPLLTKPGAPIPAPGLDSAIEYPVYLRDRYPG